MELQIVQSIPYNEFKANILKNTGKVIRFFDNKDTNKRGFGMLDGKAVITMREGLKIDDLTNPDEFTVVQMSNGGLYLTDRAGGKVF